MAFATSNVKAESGGSVNILVGDWTSSAGDAEGSVTVGGARVYSAFFYEQSPSSPMVAPFPFDVSVSGTLSTVTVNPGSRAVTDGRFIIHYK